VGEPCDYEFWLTLRALQRFVSVVKEYRNDTAMHRKQHNLKIIATFYVFRWRRFVC